jgi:hypothetical protein
MTRHTPRDLLRLFEEIRKVEEAESAGSRNVILRQDVVREGVLRYAKDYFVGAIRNEFAGTEGGPQAASAAISALKSLGKQEFDRADFKKALDDLEVQVPLNDKKLLELLFYAGAIGNVVGRGDNRYMQFYHRRDESEIYLRGRFILHNALIHAWAMPYGG